MNPCLQVRTNIKNSCLTVDVSNVTNNLLAKINTINSLLVKINTINNLLVKINTINNLNIKVNKYANLNVNTCLLNDLNVKITTLDSTIEKYVQIGLIENAIHVNTVILGKIVNICCCRVCSVSSDDYLKVIPDMVWLTPDVLASAEFDIISNVTWKII